ncbi:GAF domain-containing sensor histidine kinase [Baekduia soli]|uniref:GAF domain-containing sensor histidine kinase n=1 Tax=Baekduia soli TaxID=496014 RepID=A0A5B8U9I3_9ACTN|nr:GAF domain-containing sensor histidine kinase [Baekduia soli]QEC49829.1 GAF domain-containing sensor histidine kinase [Baekduia soli]
MDVPTLTRLIDVGRGLLSELELDTVLERMLDVACEVTGAQFAAVGVLDSRRERLARFLTRGIPAGHRAAIGELPSGRGVLGLLIKDPRPLRMDDVGAHAQSYGFPLNHPPMGSFLGVPIIIRGEAWGNLYLTDKQGGGGFTADDEQAMVVLADWAAIAVDNARLYQDVASRRDGLERTVRALETTTEIASAIAGEVELDRILELLTKRGRALVDARTIVVVLPAADALEVAAAAGEVPDGLLAPTSDHGRSVLEGIMRSRRPGRLTDLHRQAGKLFSADLQAKAGLMVPMLHRGQPLGVLAAFDRLDDGPEFSTDDERLLQAFAASAATAVATAQSVASLSLERSIRASEAERTRWARELHDETLQELGGLRVLLSAARRSADPVRVDEALGQAIELVTGGIANLRALIADLRPAALDEIGTGAALAGLAERVRAISGLAIDLVVDLDFEEGRAATRHDPDLEETVYRTVQEALTNAVKHAQATRVAVTVTETDGTLTIAVTDDGRGFDPGESADGFGLVGMRERIALAHGSLDLRSAPGAGAVLEARLPVRRREAGGVSVREAQAPVAGAG